jgi:peptidoglycan/LPS O-acetylase OafA/YrhL
MEARTSLARYQSLDLWRGLAALLVVVFHAFASYTGASYSDYHPVVGACWLVGGSGWLGVHIFFVVSGYCIAAAVDAAVGRGNTVFSFLRDRVLRIYPTYWMALVFLVAVGGLTAPFIGKSPASALPQSLASFVPDIFLVQPFFTNQFFLLVSWSLAYEVFFYVMCAVGMWLLLAGWPGALVLGVGFCLSLLGLFLPTGSFPFDLWPEFFLGVLSYMFLRSQQSRNTLAALSTALMGLVLIGIGVTTKNSYPLTMFATASVTALGLALLHRFDSVMSELKWLKPVAYLGVISYSLYLVHLIVVSKVMNLSKRVVTIDSLWVMPVVLLATVAAIVTGVLFYRFIEAPLERWRKGVGRRARGEAVVAGQR